MKNQFLIVIAMLCLGACKKVDNFSLPGNNTPGISSAPGTVQNLGHVFSGTNISWKLHPLDQNNTPLFTYLPNQNNGYCLLMIDNGEMDGLTPIHAFRFVAVNMQTMTSKIVTVSDANGNPANYTLGRVTRYVFGMDKKFYVATEGSPTGGGHLIQYDPETQTAKDFGKPFQMNGSYLAIFTLNVGTDGALYGGSFGGEGEVKTFRYDGVGFEVDATPLDSTSRYVTSISGDSRYTYAVCGKNNWILYVIDRETGEKRKLKCNYGSSTPIDIATHTDAPYAHSVATHYKLDGFNCDPLPEYHAPTTYRLKHVPYSEVDPNVPVVSWSDAEKKLSYQLSNGQTGSIRVDGLQESIITSRGPMLYHNNKLYLASCKQGIVGTYTDGEGFDAIGSTSMSIYTMLPPPANSGSDNIALGGYPKGALLQYSPSQHWSVNVSSLTGNNNGFATPSSNPKQAAAFQNADARGVNGSMVLMAMGYTNGGYIAGAGNNDRITGSSGRELSIGSYKNGTVNNLFLPEFSQYEYQAFCMSKDNNYAFVGALPRSGNNGKIYKYDPATNSIAASYDMPVWGDRNVKLSVLSNTMLVGTCDDAIFLFDLSIGTIVWKQALGQGRRIHTMTVAPDNSVYISYLYRSSLNFKLSKFQFDFSNSAAQAKVTDITEFNDQDNDERTKPSDMLVVPSAVPGMSDLYISGLNSLYRIKV